MTPRPCSPGSCVCVRSLWLDRRNRSSPIVELRLQRSRRLTSWAGQRDPAQGTGRPVGGELAATQQTPRSRPGFIVAVHDFIEVVSFDWNCPKYITPRYTTEGIQKLVAPIKRSIQEHLLDPLATKWLAGEFKPGEKIEVVATGDSLTAKAK